MKAPAARELIAFAIIGLFAYAFVMNPTEELMVGAIIAAFSTAYGFYLGGSKVGSDTAIKNADAIAGQAQSPRQVEVVNDPTQPVPVSERSVE